MGMGMGRSRAYTLLPLCLVAGKGAGAVAGEEVPEFGYGIAIPTALKLRAVVRIGVRRIMG